MAFRDQCNNPVIAGDVVCQDGLIYRVQCVMPYLMATTLIVENLKTGKVETLLLRDVKKI